MGKNKPLILLGYSHPDCKPYRTDLKFLGRVVVGIGAVFLTIAVIPNGLGFIFYPAGFGLLGLVGINFGTRKKKIRNKFRYYKWKLQNHEI